MRFCVLVVEDEWLIREEIVRFLKAEGCAVFEAASGEEAVVYLENGHMIDAVFTDLRLGEGLTGWDVAEAFREKLPQVRIVYTSGDVLAPRRDVSDSVFSTNPTMPKQS
jgi:CheY-like chemotaxis protein